MRRGTTPTIVITLPFYMNTVSNFEIYFSQYDELKLTKPMSECDFDPESNIVTVTLSQEETLALGAERTDLQMRFYFVDGSVDATGIVRCKVGKILKDGEIDGN